jgi:hypothetical protein
MRGRPRAMLAPDASVGKVEISLYIQNRNGGIILQSLSKQTMIFGKNLLAKNKCI